MACALGAVMGLHRWHGWVGRAARERESGSGSVQHEDRVKRCWDHEGAGRVAAAVAWEAAHGRRPARGAASAGRPQRQLWAARAAHLLSPGM